MGRFDSLNPETQDLVHCLLPGLATSFGLTDCLNIIPEDIRMRAWDVDRRDHIKDKTENDPRNWGVQFLKDLMAISRMKGGNLAEFQADLRAKVALHEPKHPWCRLADIKELKDEYENPGRKLEVQDDAESTEEDAYDSYFEELVEPDLPRGQKRGRRARGQEQYEARVQQPAKRHHGRLRRTEEGSFRRKNKYEDKHTADRNGQHVPRLERRRAIALSDNEEDDDIRFADRHTPDVRRDTRHSSMQSAKMPAKGAEGSVSSFVMPSGQTSALSPPPVPTRSVTHSIDTSKEPLAVLRLQAELEVAEAELKTARLRYQYIQAKEMAEMETESSSGVGTEDSPRSFD